MLSSILWGKVVQEPGLYQFWGGFWASIAQRMSPLCAAGRQERACPDSQDRKRSEPSLTRAGKGTEMEV